MIHKVVIRTLSLMLLSFHSAYGAESAPPQDVAAAVNDPRQLVTMPAEARDNMRQDMLDHLSALNEILGYLAKDELDAAAETAEKRLGKSSMGKYRATGMGPGRFMPLEMRNIGWGMHEAASDFATTARQGESRATFAALQRVINSCSVCHYSYRTR